MKSITLDTVVKRTKDHIASRIDEEVVMMSILNGNYYSLEAVGSRIWELLEDEITVSGLCERLIEEFDVDPQQCQNDVLAFLNDCAKEKLIDIGGSGSASD